jgi:hypothetical protein
METEQLLARETNPNLTSVDKTPSVGPDGAAR